jgi:enoyl-CoA hydratase/carnithine racemase
MLSSEWIEATQAVEMRLAWRAVPDAELRTRTQSAAMAIAALDVDAVAATKRLLTTGRADICRAAITRESAEMARLLAPGAEA